MAISPVFYCIAGYFVRAEGTLWEAEADSTSKADKEADKGEAAGTDAEDSTEAVGKGIEVGVEGKTEADSSRSPDTEAEAGMAWAFRAVDEQ